ncbi:probable serine carboxypeptidase CPVL isoform X2 [Ptychodera flava]
MFRSNALRIIALLFIFNPANASTPLKTIFKGNIPQFVNNGVDPGSPLFLTPLLEAGKIEEARNLSVVGMLEGTSIKSYAGFFTVNKQYDSNMFFWFIPAKENPVDAPVVLWLQGGPGGSSLFGLFVENGPFVISKDQKLSNRKITWQNKYSMLYIDNPVGTGFSFTKDEAGYARNETAVGNDLYSALLQFFQVYYEYQKNDFYATGESYAGKYVPAVSYTIHKENPRAKVKINLKGMAIGDGLCDPESMFPAYGDFMYETGQLDENQRDYVNSQVDIASQYIQQKKWKDCLQIFDTLLNGDITPYPSFYYNATGSKDYYNFLRLEEPEEFSYYNSYLALGEVRHAIHVGNLTYNDGSKVEHYLLEDICQSVKPWVIELLNNDYKAMFYNGQLDIIVANPLTQRFLAKLEWKRAAEYRKAERTIWKINNGTDVAGYVRAVGPGKGTMFQVMVRGAGHIAPYDQPERLYDMIVNFIG